MNSNIKVLIGDDTAENGVNIASQLRKYGFYAYTRKKDGNIILDSIENDIPDVVVVDLTLPNIDAISLMRRTKKLNSKSPQFIITAPFENPFMNSNKDKSNPFNIDDIVKKIDAKIAESEEQERLEQLEKTKAKVESKEEVNVDNKEQLSMNLSEVTDDQFFDDFFNDED